MATSIADKPRWTLILRTREQLDEDLGAIGLWVGPRKGGARRTAGDREDWVLRRLLVALAEADRIRFPLDIQAERDRKGEPDFLCRAAGGQTFSIEVAEAGKQSYQAWLTRTESETDCVLQNDDGYAGNGPERDAAADIVKAISDKVRAYDEGSYRRRGPCDLVVYDNSETGWMADRDDVVRRVRAGNDLQGRFREVHVLWDSAVVLDVFGSANRIDVSKSHVTDFVAWTGDQAARLRRTAMEADFARANIAEELETLGRSDKRALQSHLANLYAHLLKWRFQPSRRGVSWRSSIDQSRTDIYDLIDESPSLRNELPKFNVRAYARGRRTAATEMHLSLSALTEDPPWQLEQVLDPEFLPEEDPSS
jgi:Domain of unknown function DUF29